MRPEDLPLVQRTIYHIYGRIEDNFFDYGVESH